MNIHISIQHEDLCKYKVGLLHFTHHHIAYSQPHIAGLLIMIEGVRCHFIWYELHWTRDLDKIASRYNLKKMTVALPPEDFRGDACTCVSQCLQHTLLCLTNNEALQPQMHCLPPYLPLTHQLLKYQSIISQANIKPSLHEKKKKILFQINPHQSLLNALSN